MTHSVLHLTQRTGAVARPSHRSLLPFTPLTLIAVVCAFSVNAQQRHATFQYGDIIAGGQTPSMIIAAGRFDWYLPDGTLNKRMAETMFGELPLDVALDATGNVYWPTFHTIRVLDNTGLYVRDFPRYSANSFLVIAFDRAGNSYTDAPSGSQGNIAKTTPAGDLITTFLLPVHDPRFSVNSIDLAADQCTMYYTSFGKRVLRYDVCRDVALPDLASSLPGISAEQLRILPDGGVLVAMVDRVVRLSSSGLVVHTYALPGEQQWTNVALNVDGQSFWATSFDKAYLFNLEAGTLIGSFQSSDYWFNAIAVVGEPRAATAGPGTAIPTLSEWLLLGLILTLVAVGLLRLERS